jgi:Phage tail protein
MPLLRLSRAFIDDVKIHDLDDVACPFKLHFSRLTRPPRKDVVQRGQQHGMRNRTRFVDGAVFDFTGSVRGPSHTSTADAFDALEGVLYDYGAEHVLRFLRIGRTEEERALVRLAGIDAPSEPDEPYRTLYALTLESEDPRIYSASLRSAAYDPTDSLSGGGVAMPLAFPLVFSTTTTTHLEVSNDGTWESPPVFEVSGPVVNPIIDNDTTGVSIALIHTLGVNDQIEVDVAQRTIRLNGAERPDLYDPTQSSWFELVPGTNRLRLRGSGMAADVTSLGVQYRDAR